MRFAGETWRLSLRLAALKIEVAYIRCESTLRAFNPAQPRIPAGNSNGGQWTAGDGSGGSPANVGSGLVFVGNQDGGRYRVDLRQEEDRGGHALREHVQKTDDDMMQRVHREHWDSLFVSAGRQRDGSFSSIEAANDFVNRTLENNIPQVDAVAEGRQDEAFITHRFGYRTGREAYRKDGNPAYLRDTYSVGVNIVHSSNRVRGIV